MNLTVVAIGRLKPGPERDLERRYLDRLRAMGRTIAISGVEVRELPESRARSPRDRKDDEATRLLATLPAGAALIALDETGREMPSARFARSLAQLRDEGVRELAFAIGGADGHGPAIQTAARISLALSQLTLPHALARIMLIEQLYRAATIIAGHPYHRA